MDSIPAENPAPESKPPQEGLEPTLRMNLKTGLGVLALVVGVVLFWYTAPVLLVFFAAIFLGVFFSGLAQLLQKRTSFSYSTCLIFSLLGLMLLFILAGFIIGPAVASQSSNLSEELPKAFHQLADKLRGSQWGSQVISVAKKAMESSKDGSFQSVLKFGGLTIHGLGGVIFAVVIGVFLAAQPELYRGGFLALFPRERRGRWREVLDELGFTLWWWLMGQLMTMASVGILIGIGLTFLGVPLSGTLGLIAAILAFIPSLGPLISVIPAIMLGLTISPSMGLWVCLLYLGVQTLEANLISPLVQRRAIDLPPAFVLGSELLMGLLLGGAGLAFATPLAAVILVLINMLYIQDFLKEPGNLPSRKHKEKAEGKAEQNSPPDPAKSPTPEPVPPAN